MVDQINMREAFKVAQAFFIFGKYLRPPASALRIGRLDWCFLCNSMLAMDDADGFVLNVAFCHFAILSSLKDAPD